MHNIYIILMIGPKGKQVMSYIYQQQQCYYYYYTISSSLPPPLINAVSRISIIQRPTTNNNNNITVTMNNSRRQEHTVTAFSNELEAVAKNKRAVRTTVKKQLKNMDPTSRSQQDDAIQNIVLEAPWFKSCKRLCAYISCSALREVDTSNLLKMILHSPDGQSLLGKKLYVPRVEDKERNMRMFHISKIDDLVANSMNILEPAPVDAEGNEREDVMLANEPVDLLLLPGLAFDKSGRRLGRGGGYYDTFLMRYQELVKERNWKQPLLALSYTEQIMEEGVVPVTPTDVPVDALVTSSGVIPINPAALDNCH